ncbi:unnamed protein product [Mytilus coruscus]|uniref:CARD domain-containing protein n=1 Tax=Mytilus coruscus TaxID=42192 RepID=A0A6J8CTJ5_MYTCO|nr:unnamed protein product [Mytilus coruscus]
MDGDPIAEAIIKNLVYIKQNITSFETIVDVLISKEIIGLHERSNFVSHGISHSERIQEVINEVLKKGATYDFITALIDFGNEHVAEQILSLDEEATLEREKYEILNEIKSLKKNHQEQVAHLDDRIIKLQDEMTEKDKQIAAQNEELRKLKEMIEEHFTRHDKKMNEMSRTLEKVSNLCEKNDEKATDTEDKKGNTQKPNVRQTITSKNREGLHRANKHKN